MFCVLNSFNVVNFFHSKYFNFYTVLDKDKKFVRGKIEEFYFLPDPQKLINTHYPDDKNWQLLPIPKIVKFDDYEVISKHSHIFFSFISLKFFVALKNYTFVI